MQKVRVKIDLKTSWFFIYYLPPYSLGLISFVFFFLLPFVRLFYPEILANLQRKSSLAPAKSLFFCILFVLSFACERFLKESAEAESREKKDSFRTGSLSRTLLFVSHENERFQKIRICSEILQIQK